MSAEAAATGVEILVVAGGDGLLSEVVNGLMSDPAAASRMRLGLLPLGTGNDAARGLGLPGALRDALGVVRRGRWRWIDLGRITAVGGRRPGSPPVRWFMNMALVGPVAGLRLEPAQKRMWGRFAYLRRALPELLRLRACPIGLTLEGGERLRTEGYVVALANGPYMGGGVPIAASARPDDGLLDVVLVPAVARRRLPGLVLRNLRGRTTPGRGIVRRRVRVVDVEVPPEVPFNVDGEVFRMAPARVEMWPAALRVIVPDGMEPDAIRRSGAGPGGVAREGMAPGEPAS